jgi:predicted alpha/beta hydrolase family esterase
VTNGLPSDHSEGSPADFEKRTILIDDALGAINYMKNVILLHGRPSKAEYYSPLLPSISNTNWHPWIQQQLSIRDIPSQTPELPRAWKPHYPTWRKEFERYDITPDTALVGHSCGGGFLVRWLSEHPDVRVGKVILVAPSLGYDWVEDDFFEFKTDPTLTARTKGLTIYGSDNDSESIQKSIRTLRASIKDVAYREFSGYGHFAVEDIGSGFPELLQELLV